MLDKLRLLPAAFRGYEWIRALDPRALRRNRPYRVHSPDGLAIPSARLVMKVAGSPDVFVYLEGGRLAAEDVERMLAESGTVMSSLQSLLDFGCGCGRVLRRWKDLRGVDVHGTDLNPELARWCAEHLPFARVTTNALAPPTRYTARAFDLVYALSVLTHLPETGQLAWMEEFRRILRPGGALMLTTHGAQFLDRLSDPERTLFLSGALVIRNGRSAGTNLCNAYHPEAYVRGTLARGYDVAVFAPGGSRGSLGQDAWLLRKRL